MEGGAVGHNFEMDPPKEHPCQVWFNLVQSFQRRRFKCESLRRTTDAKWWQKLTWPLARWAKKQTCKSNIWKNVSIEQECPHFQLKSTCTSYKSRGIPPDRKNWQKRKRKKNESRPKSNLVFLFVSLYWIHLK
jgi:hypothetical protein